MMGAVGPSRATIAAALVALWVGGCGGDEDSEAPEEIPGGADQEEARVIEDWADTLREGDIEGAAEFFALPSLVQNGTPALELETRQQVVEFNEALPCGAELVSAETAGDYTIATFELTERPGPGECGDGVGNTAKTAFGISDEGEIERWIRVVDSDDASPLPPDDGPVV